MNVVLVSDNPEEGDILKRELNKQASEIRIESILDSKNAFTRLSASSACDAILLDSSVSIADAVNLVSAIRLTKRSTGIVALVGEAENDTPAELIRAGVDKLIVKSPEAVPLLEEALLKATERHQPESASDTRQVRIIYAGDVQDIRPHLSNDSHWVLETIELKAEGPPELPAADSSRDEAVVIDCTSAGENILKAIGDIRSQTPDTPVILLIDPEDDEISTRAMKA